MEEFWQSSLEIINRLRKIVYFSCDAPVNLVKNALMEERYNSDIARMGISHLMPSRKSAEEELLSWIEDNDMGQRIKESMSREDIEKYKEKIYRDILDKTKESLIKVVESYISITDLSLSRIKDSYGRLDFFSGIKKYEKN